MNAFESAFAKAGIPPASVAFATACHDLARLALNRQADPERAAHAWLGMAGGAQFRAALVQFIAAVADERRGEAKSDGAVAPLITVDQDVVGPAPSDPISAKSATSSESSEAHGTSVAQAAIVDLAPLSELNTKSGDDVGHTRHVSHIPAVPSSPEPDADGVGHHRLVDHLSPAPPSANRTALIAARTQTARVMSGVFIPDHKGGSEPFDDLRVRFYDLTEKRLARMVGRGSVAYNLIRLAKMRRPANHEQLSGDATSRDVFSAEEIRTMQREAAVFAGHGLISLPEELRSAVSEAVSAGEAA